MDMGEIGKDDRLMDGNDQEKERGITILAKNAAIDYKGVKVCAPGQGMQPQPQPASAQPARAL